MKIQEFIDGLPDLEKAKADGDAWCIVFFSRKENSYRGSFEMDSGDALIVIEEIMQECGIDPERLAAKPFDATANGVTMEKV